MLAYRRGLPKQIWMDNGSELISNALEGWAETHKVELAFIEQGKPAQNAFMERFNRTYREDVLDAIYFPLFKRFATSQMSGSKSTIPSGLMKPWRDCRPINIWLTRYK